MDVSYRNEISKLQRIYLAGMSFVSGPKVKYTLGYMEKKPILVQKWMKFHAIMEFDVDL